MKLQDTTLFEGNPFVRHTSEVYPIQEIITRSHSFFEHMEKRRSVRAFSNKPFPKEIINNLVQTASTAPSGAHKQPWTFCIVSDASIKSRIRVAAEKEEFKSYQGRMSEEWIEDLKPLGTDWKKPFLEIAPYLIIVFKKAYDVKPDGTKRNNYYVNESVGIACGFLLAAIHNAGLVALTHTPSPMNFLSKILNRPENERPYLLIPVGLPANETFVPQLERKTLSEIAAYY